MAEQKISDGTGEDRKDSVLYLLGIMVESKLLTLKIIVAYHLNALLFFQGSLVLIGLILFL